jgi:hypothetical protein
MKKRLIIVITPVKNESWILDFFLKVTSTFADMIIIADQNSTDNSKEICMRYPKVHLIQNNSKDFNEPYRQKLLINEARKVSQDDKVIFALDADEILTADSLQSFDWNSLHTAKKGTTIYFHKPDLYSNTSHYLFYDNPFPLAYIDDGAEHLPKLFHCSRIPISDSTHKLFCSGIQFMHFGLTRLNAQRSKIRMYSCIENLLSTSTNRIKDFKRRKRHSRFKTYLKDAEIKKTPSCWLDNWKKKGIFLDDINEEKFYSYDIQVLNMIYKYGCPKFWFDDIWFEENTNFNLEVCRIHFLSNGFSDIPKSSLVYPNGIIKIQLRILDYIIKSIYATHHEKVIKNVC